MLPADWMGSILAYALNRDPLPSGGGVPAESLVPLNQLLSVGQTVQGVVAAQVAANVYTVNIAGQMVQLPLPSTYTPGSLLTLKVLTVSPQLTFSLSDSSVGPTPSPPPQSTATELGTTAQWIADLAQGTLSSSAGVISSPGLLSATSTLDPAQLAQSLHQSLAVSGLFYESHQAQWINGQQTTAHLMLQPQNQPNPTLLSTQGTPQPAMVLSSESMASSPATVATAGTKLAGLGAMIPTEGSNVAIPVPGHLMGLVQQQLAILETGRIVWQGHLVPDQPLQWQLWPDGARGSQVSATWHTQLQLELPRLGTVVAQVTLDSQGVRMRLSADHPDTQHTLVQQRSSLIQALGQVGINVLAADVVPPGATGGLHE
ncbi:MAG: flagellar hook-length control protein FliK [Betaproteobacteria bacterium]|jgi:Flagellar hook-length control protein FliK.|nr:flagellar hook-length control protein FliK [Betaproteobacteria bacterium]